MTLAINRFTARVRHDAGYITVRGAASSEDAFIYMVMKAERCPRSAIRGLIGPDFEYPDWSHKTIGGLLKEFK